MWRKAAIGMGFVLILAHPYLGVSYLFKNRGRSGEENENKTCTASAKKGPPKAQFHSTRSGSIEVPAGGKEITTYLRSKEARRWLLFADCFEEYKDNRFKCAMDPIQFFSEYIVPILNMSLSFETSPSLVAVVTAVSGELNSTTRVTWSPKPEADAVVLTSEQTMFISMEKPAWLLAPNSMFNRVGDMIVGQILKSAIPEYLEGLRDGYKAWDPSTKAVA